MNLLRNLANSSPSPVFIPPPFNISAGISFSIRLHDPVPVQKHIDRIAPDTHPIDQVLGHRNLPVRECMPIQQFPYRLRLLEGDSHKVDRVPQPPPDIPQGWHFRQAGRTGDEPEVDQGGFTRQVQQVELLAGEIPHDHGWEGIPHLQSGGFGAQTIPGGSAVVELELHL
jgi:hypothetical protein